MPAGRLLNLLFPARCPLCGETSDGELSHPLCRRCWGEIRRYTGPSCSSCRTPLPSVHSILCERCFRENPPFAGVFYYGLYEGVLREAIHLLKFRGIKRIALPLCDLLSQFPRPEADAIVPVPLHERGLRKRGFNQAAVMGRHLSRQWGIPLLPDALRKVRETPPQTEVTGKERMENLRGSFQASGPVGSLRIVLVDDVITTGATVRECSRTLLKAGAKEVIVIAIACTPAH
jgi:ComF family protein